MLCWEGGQPERCHIPQDFCSHEALTKGKDMHFLVTWVKSSNVFFYNSVPYSPRTNACQKKNKAYHCRGCREESRHSLDVRCNWEMLFATSSSKPFVTFGK
eukprot:1748852-Karenia_brevis.AAC.1